MAETPELRARFEAMAERDRESPARMLVERFTSMLAQVEWVRQASGTKYACPFCHGISERDGGPGHAEDCDWRAVMHATFEELLPTSVRTPKDQGCINCGFTGEEGYETEGVGPFCPTCWDSLMREFPPLVVERSPSAPEVKAAPPVGPVFGFDDWWQTTGWRLVHSIDVVDREIWSEGLARAAFEQGQQDVMRHRLPAHVADLKAARVDREALIALREQMESDVSYWFDRIDALLAGSPAPKE